jgi:hypothetical protein
VCIRQPDEQILGRALGWRKLLPGRMFHSFVRIVALLGPD